MWACVDMRRLILLPKVVSAFQLSCSIFKRQESEDGDTLKISLHALRHLGSFVAMQSWGWRPPLFFFRKNTHIQ